MNDVSSRLVIFSFLGYMAKNLDRDISSVAATGPGLVFIVYPQAISTLLYSPVWSVMFFLMLITLGLDSTVRVLDEHCFLHQSSF